MKEKENYIVIANGCSMICTRNSYIDIINVLDQFEIESESYELKEIK